MIHEKNYLQKRLDLRPLLDLLLGHLFGDLAGVPVNVSMKYFLKYTFIPKIHSPKFYNVTSETRNNVHILMNLCNFKNCHQVCLFLHPY